MTEYTSVRAKLKRAEDHLADLESELVGWIRSKPLALIPTLRADGRTEDHHIKITNPLPIAANLIAGDSVHNFRSALDHLVMALALDNGADPYDSSISFPVFDRRDRFFRLKPDGTLPARPQRGSGSYAIRALRPAAQHFIEGGAAVQQGRLVGAN